MLISMAKQMPTLPPAGEIMTVLMPTNRAFRWINPPPELPESTAESV